MSPLYHSVALHFLRVELAGPEYILLKIAAHLAIAFCSIIIQGNALIFCIFCTLCVGKPTKHSLLFLEGVATKNGNGNRWQKTLFTPGPLMVSDRVKQAMIVDLEPRHVEFEYVTK